MSLSAPALRTIRRRLCVALLWTLAGVAVPAPATATDAPLPISTSELCLLLRGGCTGAEVLRDTAGRPLLDPLDASAEKLLRAAGADPTLIAALRRGRPVASPAQARAERARQEEFARQRLAAWEADQERLREVNQTALETSQATRAQEARQNMAHLLSGKLVVYRDQRVQTYDESHLSDKKQFAFYFATRVDPACQKFTPQLVKFYRQYAANHPEFELVFISKDYSFLEMETDLRSNDMPWPALDYPQIPTEKGLAALGDGSLPRLLVFDGAGRPLMDSADAGPQHVLDALAQGPATAAVAGR